MEHKQLKRKMVNNMFELDVLVLNKETKQRKWKYYYQSNDIDQIYRNIETRNLENEFSDDNSLNNF